MINFIRASKLLADTAALIVLGVIGSAADRQRTP